MTIRTIYFGSTDWVDGEILYAADLNDTYNNMFIFRAGSLVGNTEFQSGGVYQELSGCSFTVPLGGIYSISACIPCNYSGTPNDNISAGARILYGAGSPYSTLVTVHDNLSALTPVGTASGNQWHLAINSFQRLGSNNTVLLQTMTNTNGMKMWVSGAIILN